jgi:hypothetical protein
MAKSTNLNFTQEIEVVGKRLTSSDTTSYVTLYTSATNDAVVKSITVTTTDTSAVNLKVAISDGTTDFLLGTVRVALASGTDGAVASVDILGSSLLPGLPRDLNSRSILPLKNGYILKVGCLVTMTAAKQTDILAVVEEY